MNPSQPKGNPEEVAADTVIGMIKNPYYDSTENISKEYIKEFL